MKPGEASMTVHLGDVDFQVEGIIYKGQMFHRTFFYKDDQEDHTYGIEMNEDQFKSLKNDLNPEGYFRVLP